MKISTSVLLATVCASTSVMAKSFYAKDYGIAPSGSFTAADVSRMMEEIRASKEPNTLVFEPGVYRLGEEQCQHRTWFISNHDQKNPRRVFLPVEQQSDLTIEATGVFWEVEVPMLYVGIWDSEKVTVRGLTCDYVSPLIAQLDILAVDAEKRTVTFRPLPEVKAVVNEKREFIVQTPDAVFSPNCGILFEANGRTAYYTSDFYFPLNNVTDNGDGTFTMQNYAHQALAAGQHMATRPWLRPAPGIVISDSKDVALDRVTVHYADGMGLLAQATENITLKQFAIVPNKAKGRFFSTQADATHFSGCKGVIDSIDGSYIGMMDDAINVHGTYLRLMKRIDDRTLEGQYMHPQAYGFTWGKPGDSVSFIRSNTMESLPEVVTLDSVIPVDQPTTQAGAKVFRLTFKEALPKDLDPTKDMFGIENLTWTPEVVFKGNYIANNRARGALFSTPQKVVCTTNVFDHVSGCGVLLCGDCNGWFETGACKDVLIEENVFINNLTSRFQFTEAVISICPEIPKIKEQVQPLHSNITIRNNMFMTFDTPIVYAMSVNGLVIRDNLCVKTLDYKPFFGNREWLTLINCTHVDAETPRQVN